MLGVGGDRRKHFRGSWRADNDHASGTAGDLRILMREVRFRPVVVPVFAEECLPECRAVMASGWPGQRL